MNRILGIIFISGSLFSHVIKKGNTCSSFFLPIVTGLSPGFSRQSDHFLGRTLLINGLPSPSSTGYISNKNEHRYFQRQGKLSELNSLANGDEGEEVNGNMQIVENVPTSLKFQKYLAMQEKKVQVSISYSEGLESFYLTVAKKITNYNPDVFIKSVVLPVSAEKAGDEDPSVFEVLIEGKTVIGKGRSKWQAVSRSGSKTSADGNNMANGMSVFISMSEINSAIGKAMRKRRPATVYTQTVVSGGGKTAIRLDK